VLPGSAIIGFWYWCTDQYIVQRVLAGKNQQQSRRGAILAAFLKLTPVFIFLVPGMIAFALTSVPGTGFSTSGDAAYTSLVAQILPHGLRGMVACSMIVALMASLASKFNAAATLVTMDFFRERYPNATGRTEVFCAKGVIKKAYHGEIRLDSRIGSRVHTGSVPCHQAHIFDRASWPGWPASAPTPCGITSA